jgi:hypothetical protein
LSTHITPSMMHTSPTAPWRTCSCKPRPGTPPPPRRMLPPPTMRPTLPPPRSSKGLAPGATQPCRRRWRAAWDTGRDGRRGSAAPRWLHSWQWRAGRWR